MNIRPEYKQILFACAPLLNTISQGLLTGYPTTLIPALTANDTDLKIEPHHVKMIITLPVIISVITVISLGPLMHIYGRKKSHILFSLPMSIGWILISTATSPTMLLIGLSLNGLSNGGPLFIATCISELTNPNLRGTLLSCKSVGYSIGVFLSHLSGFYFTWRTNALMFCVPSSLAVIVTLFWYETPDWFISQEKYVKAEKIFYAIRGRKTEYDNEIKGMIEVDVNRRKDHLKRGRNSVKSTLKSVFSKTFLRPMAILFSTIILVEFSGRRAFTIFSVQITEEIIGNGSKFTLSLVLDSIMIFCTISSMFFIRYFRRRTLILGGGFAAVGILFTSSILLYVKTFAYRNALHWISSLLLCIYYFLFNSTFIPVCLCLIGELIPLEFRPLGAIVEGLAIASLGTLTVNLVPILQESTGIHGLFLVYSIAMFLSLLYIAYDLPETKDISLNDISEYFRGNKLKSEIGAEQESTELIQCKVTQMNK